VDIGGLKMYEQDYVMRQIKDLAKAIAKIFFNVDVESSAMEVIRDMQAKEKAMELLRQCDDKNICYAEGELFDLIKNNTMDNLLVGITFYSYLNDMDDEKLTEADFSRDKIQDGITKLLSVYGLENMAHLFFYEA
jgi:muconolactone delta-isomerase